MTKFLADMTGSDDAGVYKISDTLALVQTLDFLHLWLMIRFYLVRLPLPMH